VASDPQPTAPSPLNGAGYGRVVHYVSHSRRIWTILATVFVACACAATTAPSPPASPTAVPWPSSADVNTIRGIINSRAGDELSSIGIGDGTVDIELRAGAGDLARQIVDAYGDLVHVTLGFFRYPSGALVADACAVPWTFANPGSLRAIIETANPQITSGATFHSTIRITNFGGPWVRLETSSSLQVYLFPPGDTKPVGTFDLVALGTGLWISMDSGRSVTIPGDGGTASCDISLGYTLPPGPYEARALVDFAQGPADGQGPLVFWSDAFGVQIVPAP
jgi:hypothetical protein